jgi:hypothetical protein
VLCGPLILQIAQQGKSNYPEDLNLAILSQIHLIQHQFTQSPVSTLHKLKQELTRRFNSSSVSPINLLRALSEIFQVSITLYHANERLQILPAPDLGMNKINVLLYWDGDSFCGVISSSLAQIIENPSTAQTVPTTSRNSSYNNFKFPIKLCTWNLSGATSEEKQLAIDYELCNDKIAIAGVQETHLWSRQLDTHHYKWIMGPQYQRRASRGLGFLVSKFIYQYVSSIEFITPNIGSVTFQLPSMAKPCCFVNVHKHNTGTPESSLESGKKNYMAF